MSVATKVGDGFYRFCEVGDERCSGARPCEACYRRVSENIVRPFLFTTFPITPKQLEAGAREWQVRRRMLMPGEPRACPDLTCSGISPCGRCFGEMNHEVMPAVVRAMGRGGVAEETDHAGRAWERLWRSHGIVVASEHPAAVAEITEAVRRAAAAPPPPPPVTTSAPVARTESKKNGKPMRSGDVGRTFNGEPQRPTRREREREKTAVPAPAKPREVNGEAKGSEPVLPVEPEVKRT